VQPTTSRFDVVNNAIQGLAPSLLWKFKKGSTMTTHFGAGKSAASKVPKTSRVLGKSGMCRQTHELMTLTARRF
jgi:hypothetical protein